MCYYERIRFSCGCAAWGGLQAKCDQLMPSKRVRCGRRQVGEHVYQRTSKRCEKCQENHDRPLPPPPYYSAEYRPPPEMPMSVLLRMYEDILKERRERLVKLNLIVLESMGDSKPAHTARRGTFDLALRPRYDPVPQQRDVILGTADSIEATSTESRLPYTLLDLPRGKFVFSSFLHV